MGEDGCQSVSETAESRQEVAMSAVAGAWFRDEVNSSTLCSSQVRCS